jgi:hypothetical protein
MNALTLCKLVFALWSPFESGSRTAIPLHKHPQSVVHLNNTKGRMEAAEHNANVMHSLTGETHRGSDMHGNTCPNGD